MIRNLGYCYYKLCKYEEAIRAFREYLNIRESTITKSDIGGIVYTLRFLGHAYKKQIIAPRLQFIIGYAWSSKGPRRERSMKIRSRPWIGYLTHCMQVGRIKKP